MTPSVWELSSGQTWRLGAEMMTGAEAGIGETVHGFVLIKCVLKTTKGTAGEHRNIAKAFSLCRPFVAVMSSRSNARKRSSLRSCFLLFVVLLRATSDAWEKKVQVGHRNVLVEVMVTTWSSSRIQKGMLKLPVPPGVPALEADPSRNTNGRAESKPSTPFALLATDDNDKRVKESRVTAVVIGQEALKKVVRGIEANVLTRFKD